MKLRFRVTVLKVRAGSRLAPGATHEVETPLTVGRGAEAQLRLDDETVSQFHARFSAGEYGIQITNRSQRGTTFFNRARMSLGETRRLGEGRTTLQLGGVLLLIQPIVTTREFEANLDDELEAVLQIDRIGSKYVIRVTGTPVHFSSRPAGALARLAASPGTTVSQAELLQAADPTYGGGNPNQLVTYVRNAIRDGIHKGDLDVEQIRNAVGEAYRVDPSTLTETKTLLKHMFENVRGAGYRLNLPPSAAVVTRS